MRHKLGQHLLISQETCDLIVDSAELQVTDTVLEIGTGLGALTERIAPRVSKVTSYEKDLAMFVYAQKKLASIKNVTLVRADAFNQSEKEGHFDVCVTSLPYSSSRQFIEWLACRSGEFRICVAVLQLEFARKLLAKASDPNYRSASAIAQIAFDLKEIAIVDRENFTPRPTVDSAIVKFEPNPNLVQPFFDHVMIVKLRRLFSFKGKLVKNALESLGIKCEPELLDSRFKSKRVEQIAPAEIASLLSGH
jgi:16S rRNA (adenine1518-N6/adenine1519-N6)-dimethyltransferase